MSSKATGYLVFVAALGTLAGLVAIDISKLENWNYMTTPQFVGNFLAHLAAVIAAFVGGKLLPEPRHDKYTRSTDITRKDMDNIDNG